MRSKIWHIGLTERLSRDSPIVTMMLFGASHGVSILLRLILNKIAAVTLGPAGLGVLSLFQGAYNFGKAGGALGINRSIPRVLASKNAATSKIIHSYVTTTVLLAVVVGSFSGVSLGIGLKIVNPDYLSDVLGNNAIVMLALCVAVGTLSDCLLAVLSGLRWRLKFAFITILISLASLVVGAILYPTYQLAAVPIVVLVSAGAACIPCLFVLRKLIRIKFTFLGSLVNKLFGLGSTLFLIGVLNLGAEFGIKSYLAISAGYADLAIYQVGLTIISGYVGVLMSALLTDYLPKISAPKLSNDAIQKAVNDQIWVGLFVVTSVLVPLILFSGEIVRLLYTDAFSTAATFLTIALISALMFSLSNPLDLILIAKNQARLLLYFALVYRSLQLVISVVIFERYGLTGLACSMVALQAFHTVAMIAIVNKCFSISLAKEVYLTFSLQMILVISLVLAKNHAPLDIGTRLAVVSVVFAACGLFLRVDRARKSRVA